MSRQVLTLPDVPGILLTQDEGDARYLQPATAASTYVPLTGGSVLTGQLGPTTTTTRDLGTSALRWRTLYARDGNFSGSVTASSLRSTNVAGASIYLDAPAGTDRSLSYWSNGAYRWEWQVNATAEGGANAGSDLELLRYSDAEALLGTALAFNRATGNAQFGSNVGVGVAPAAWRSDINALQIGGGGALSGQVGAGHAWLTANTALTTSGYQAISAAAASWVRAGADGSVQIATAPPVAAGAAQTFTPRLTMSQQGNLDVTAASGVSPLRAFVNGVLKVDVTPVGTLTLTPDAGVLALDVGGQAYFRPGSGQTLYIGVHTATSHNVGARLVSDNGPIYFYAAGGFVLPSTDNTFIFGSNADRWISLHAVNGAIQTSSVEAKTDIIPLSPDACVQAVLDTDWVAFAYKPPSFAPPEPPPDIAYDEHDSNEVKAEKKLARDAQEAEALAAHQAMLEETAPVRQQHGYVLGSDAHRVSDLFGLSDRKSATPQSDLGVVACALQDALKRIAALEQHVGVSA